MEKEALVKYSPKGKAHPLDGIRPTAPPLYRVDLKGNKRVAYICARGYYATWRLLNYGGSYREEDRTKRPSFASLACPDGLPRIRRVVSRETGWPLRPGTEVDGSHYLSRLRAPQMGSRRREDGARAALFLHLASICHRPQSGLLKGNANARRIQ